MAPLAPNPGLLHDRHRRLGGICRRVPVSLALLFLVGHTLSLRAQEALPPSPAASDVLNTNSNRLTDSLLEDRPIGELRASLAASTPEAPDNLARPRLAQEGVRAMPMGQGRCWHLEPFAWDASAVRHLPAYFEEPNLERLGYYYGCPKRCCLANGTADCPHDPHASRGFGCASGCHLGSCLGHNQVLQPMVSAANFYGRVASLPYMMGAYCPTEEIYGLGEDRPGSPVPYRKYYIPLSLKGVLYQGAAVTGLGYVIP